MANELQSLIAIVLLFLLGGLYVLSQPVHNPWDNLSTGFGTGNTTVYECGFLNNANLTYTLNQSINITGATCLTVNNTNVTIDCNGFSITGDNTGSKYGIYTTYAGTVVKNCIVSNFSTPIIFWSGATSGNIINSTGNNTVAAMVTGTEDGIRITALANANISSSTGISVIRAGIEVDGSNTIINNCSGIGTSGTNGRGIYITSGSGIQNNTVINSIGTSAASDGINLEKCNVNCSLINVTANSTSSYAIRITTASTGVIITNPTIISATSGSAGSGVYIDGGANVSINCQGRNIVGNNLSTSYGIYSNQIGTNISNCNISNFSYGIILTTGANQATIQDTNVSSSATSGYAIQIVSANSTMISNVRATSDISQALRITTSWYAIVANSTFTSGNTIPISLVSSKGGIFYNNTLITTTAASNLLSLPAASGNNTFYLNNFTNTSALYVNDINGSNFYNATYATLNQGNIYANVENGSIAVTGLTVSSIPRHYIGTSGAGVPYNNSTSGAKFSCNFAGCADNAPLFPGCSNLTVNSSNASMGSADGNASCFSAPSNHTILAVVLDAHSQFDNWTVTTGNCTVADPTVFNTTVQVNDLTRCNVQANFKPKEVIFSITPPISRDIFRVGFPPAYCVPAVNQTNVLGVYTVMNNGSTAVNVEFSMNQTVWAFDLTISNSSNCSEGLNMTTSGQLLYSDLEPGNSTMFWAWANANASLVSPPHFKVIAEGT